MDWLPPLIDCNGEWEETLEKVYQRYQTDFLERSLAFRGMPIRLRPGPRTKGKDACFWHLISEGETEEDRLPDFRRCERIGWVRAVIERANTRPDLAIWEQERKGKIHIAIALPDFSYVVFLGKRKPRNGRAYAILLTSYFVEHEWKKKKFKKQYETSQRT